MTALPAAIDGLLAIARTAPVIGMSGVRVDDGPWVSRPLDQDVVVIGWLPIEGPTVAWVEDLRGLESTTEVFDIHCLVQVWRPDMVLKAARDRADELFEAVRDEVKNNRTLNGAVATARVVAVHVTSEQNTDGCTILFEFVVHVQTF